LVFACGSQVVRPNRADRYQCCSRAIWLVSGEKRLFLTFKHSETISTTTSKLQRHVPGIRSIQILWTNRYIYRHTSTPGCGDEQLISCKFYVARDQTTKRRSGRRQVDELSKYRVELHCDSKGLGMGFKHALLQWRFQGLSHMEKGQGFGG